MITPSFALTATERVLPRLALDFTNASLDPRITFTRSGNTATVINSSGQIAMINADLPRFDYNLNTGGTCKGLLIEEQRENLLTYSNPDGAYPTGWSVGFNTGTYTKTLIDCTFVPFAFAHKAIDHVVTSGRSYMFKTFTTVIGQQYTISFYVDKANSTASGNIFSLGFGGTLNLSLANADSNGKITGTFTATLTVVEVRLGVTVTGANTGRLIFTGWQMEAGGFATSYIPTEASAVTRNADVATMTGTNFSDWFNATEGAFSIEANSFQLSSVIRRAIAVTDGTASNRILLYIDGNGDFSFLTTVAGSNVILNGGAYIRSTNYKQCGAYKLNSAAQSGNGATAVTSSSISIPTVNQMQIGSQPGASDYFNGWIAKINYWPQRLVNNEVQAFSK
jgi:hypothetical protein